MSKPKFKVGDVVRVRTNKAAAVAYELSPDIFPAPGTVGRVEDIEADMFGGWIRWADGHGCCEDRTWLPFEFVEPVIEAIVIYRRGQSVIARDRTTGRIAKAKCSPEDKFDFYKGAALALDRLFDREEPKPEEPKPYNGKVVCVRKGSGAAGGIDVTWWTVGKIYNVVDGVIRDDCGDSRSPVDSLTELNWLMTNFAEFIALVE